MPEIQYPAYRAYVESRVDVNNAMMALLAGSRLAAHTLQLTEGSTATLANLFPAVEHIERFNLRSDSARALLHDADGHLASVAVPYALATHEEFVMSMLSFMESDGKTLTDHGKAIRAWNMHTVLFESCGLAEPADWLQTFHVFREVRNCIIHAGGAISAELTDRISDMGAGPRASWADLNSGAPPEAVHANGRIALTAQHIFTALATTKGIGREINKALGVSLGSDTWARVAVSDYNDAANKTRNSTGWRRGLAGYARKFYGPANLTDSHLETAARGLGVWTHPMWNH